MFAGAGVKAEKPILNFKGPKPARSVFILMKSKRVRAPHIEKQFHKRTEAHKEQKEKHKSSCDPTSQ